MQVPVEREQSTRRERNVIGVLAQAAHGGRLIFRADKY
jgi:hypothetical protein